MIKIKIKNLNYTFASSNQNKLEVLKNVNLNINKGDFVVVLGESGCGKTTFLELVAGLLHPTSGSVWANNYLVDRPHFSRSLISQKPYLLPWLNVKDNIAFGCRLRSEKKELLTRIHRFIKLMGLDGFEKVYPLHLSLGMAQRVSFARALIGLPEILLFDEPFTSLDFFNRARLQEELIKIWQSQQQTMIFVTHDIDEAILIGRKIVILGNRPANIEHILDLNMEYPRDLTKKNLFNLKIDIQKKMRNLMDYKQ